MVRQLFLTGSTDTRDVAIVFRNQLRWQPQDNAAAKTNVTSRSATSPTSGPQATERATRTTNRPLIDSVIRPALGDTPISRLCRVGPRPFEQLYADPWTCRRHCHGRIFIEHRTP